MGENARSCTTGQIATKMKTGFGTALLFKFILALTSFASVWGDEAPHAPALATGNWPIAHASTWNSDVTSNMGPKFSKTLDSQFFINGDTVKDLEAIFRTADPITLLQTSDPTYSWGSSVSSVFQIHTDSNGISLANTLMRDFNFEYHGAYCLLAKDGTYYAAARTSIQAYNNEIPFNFSSPIVKIGEYFVPEILDDEHIVGLTMTHDDFATANLIFATTKGLVGGVSLDFKTPSTLVRVPGIENVALPDHFMSNSIAMDGPSGGIYMCTSYSISRVQWSPSDHSLKLDWNTPYGDGHDEWYWGRLGPGCGTSPTISGPHNANPEFAVITDGESPMNIRFYDVKTGEQAGSHIVSFGNKAAAFNSTSDQSIVVHGYKAVVVNNWVADVVTPFCSEWFASTGATDALKHECPFMFGAYVNGVEQFEIDPVTRQVRSVWANPDVSCTSSIPVLSDSNNILYCLGKRPQLKKRATYTIEAMDWSTGRSLFHVPLSPFLLVNSLYAATEVGTSNDIVMGTLAGLIRMADVVSPEAGGVTQHGMPTEDTLNSPAFAVWKQLEKLAAVHDSGRVPTKELLIELGLADF